MTNDQIRRNDQGRNPNSESFREQVSHLRFEWILGKKGKSEKPANLPNFSKAAEIFRKKAKFPQTPGQIHRNSSKSIEIFPNLRQEFFKR